MKEGEKRNKSQMLRISILKIHFERYCCFKKGTRAEDTACDYVYCNSWWWIGTAIINKKFENIFTCLFFIEEKQKFVKKKSVEKKRVEKFIEIDEIDCFWTMGYYILVEKDSKVMQKCWKCKYAWNVQNRLVLFRFSFIT